MVGPTFTYLPPLRRREEVERVLEVLSRGTASAQELESAAVDIKEEAGRRDKDGTILPGAKQNEGAAQQLAEAAACMANSPGGGTLVVGVDDKTGEIIGADTDPQWLRSRIYDLTERQLTVDVQSVGIGGRLLLVVDVPQAVQPVGYKHEFKHRVDARCVPVTLTELMGGLFTSLAADPSHQPSQMPIADITTTTEQALRDQLSKVDSEKARLNRRDLLGRLGLIAGDGEHLNMAGEMLLAIRAQPTIDYSHRQVPGGPSTVRVSQGGHSLLEEVLEVEAEANRHNPITEIADRFQVHRIRAIPERSLREAILNAVCHRDWSLQRPTVVEHIGNHFRVTSPGGFPGGVTERNIITHPSAPRYQTLMTAMRQIGLVEQEGVGVDLMFADMIRIGSRPPLIETLTDPAVQINLYAKPADGNWYKLFANLHPPEGGDDVDAALLVWRAAQPESPFLTSLSCADLLQRSHEDAEEALQRVASYKLSPTLPSSGASDGAIGTSPIGTTPVGGGDIDRPPLLVPIQTPRGTPPAWRLSSQTKSALGLDRSRDSIECALAWARERERISSSEYCELTGVAQATATSRLKELAEEGQIVPSSSLGRGRGFHYLPSGGDT